MGKLRVVLADDHPIVRGGLRTLIEGQPDMEVVGEASDGLAAVRVVAELTPDLVVMDVSMPALGGAEATERIKQANPGVRVVALTSYEDKGYAQLLLAAGASGYVLKRSAAEELVRALRAVAAGGVYLDPTTAGQLMPGLVGRASRELGAGVELSDREAEVLRLVARGYAIKEIAAGLDVSVRTVETYKARATEKLGLKSRADIVRYAAQRGWLEGG
jgi:DNA-binding NarL/FixJ family response regulator